LCHQQAGKPALQQRMPLHDSILITGGGGMLAHALIRALAARAGKPLTVVADQVGSPTFTDDLAAATLDLLDAGGHGVWHVTNGGQTNWFDFTQAILDEFGLKTDLSPTTS